ncbi:MAG TPA: UvrB/UvrC motif-containing protein, partial [Povalibacter sp.]|nr:UvrB/UvrC motif-containing protein [Povalibacter sp.]
MEGAYVAPEFRSVKVADAGASYRSLTPEQAVRRIKKLEQEMLKHARNLEFEEAARLRDEIQKLRNVELGLPPSMKAG